MNRTKNYGCKSYIFIALEIYILYRNVYPLYIQPIHATQVHISTSGLDKHYTGWGCLFPNSREIQCFKCKFCVWFVWFWFAWLFQQHNSGIKQDPPVCPLVQKDTKTVQTNGSMLKSNLVLNNTMVRLGVTASIYLPNGVRKNRKHYLLTALFTNSSIPVNVNVSQDVTEYFCLLTGKHMLQTCKQTKTIC
jgi:hypothetical protein